MPIGYLIAVAIPGLVTAAALTGPPRSWTLGRLCWRLSFQVNELPVLVVHAAELFTSDVLSPAARETALES